MSKAPPTTLFFYSKETLDGVRLTIPPGVVSRMAESNDDAEYQGFLDYMTYIDEFDNGSYEFTFRDDNGCHVFYVSTPAKPLELTRAVGVNPPTIKRVDTYSLCNSEQLKYATSVKDMRVIA